MRTWATRASGWSSSTTQLDGTVTEIKETLSSIGESWAVSQPLSVKQGERLYFRVKARRGGQGDDVAWDPTITYPGLATTPDDVNGLDQSTYVASGDFTLAGRPGAVMSLPEAGTGRFSATLDQGRDHR